MRIGLGHMAAAFFAICLLAGILIGRQADRTRYGEDPTIITEHEKRVRKISDETGVPMDEVRRLIRAERVSRDYP
jgi:hypothetical protein